MNPILLYLTPLAAGMGPFAAEITDEQFAGIFLRIAAEHGVLATLSTLLTVTRFQLQGTQKTADTPSTSVTPAFAEMLEFLIESSNRFDSMVLNQWIKSHILATRHGDVSELSGDIIESLDKAALAAAANVPDRSTKSGPIFGIGAHRHGQDPD